MSDVFFTNIDEAPVPPDEVRIRELAAAPRPDGGRIKVHFALTPFQKRPNVEASIFNGNGDEVSNLSVVEAIDPAMDFVMHLREAHPKGSYRLELQVFYADVEAQVPAEGDQPSAGAILNKARKVVDQRHVDFEVPSTSQN